VKCFTRFQLRRQLINVLVVNWAGQNLSFVWVEPSLAQRFRKVVSSHKKYSAKCSSTKPRNQNSTHGMPENRQADKITWSCSLGLPLNASSNFGSSCSRFDNIIGCSPYALQLSLSTLLFLDNLKVQKLYDLFHNLYGTNMQPACTCERVFGPSVFVLKYRIYQQLYIQNPSSTIRDVFNIFVVIRIVVFSSSLASLLRYVTFLLCTRSNCAPCVFLSCFCIFL